MSCAGCTDANACNYDPEVRSTMAVATRLTSVGVRRVRVLRMPATVMAVCSFLRRCGGTGCWPALIKRAPMPMLVATMAVAIRDMQ